MRKTNKGQIQIYEITRYKTIKRKEHLDDLVKGFISENDLLQEPKEI